MCRCSIGDANRVASITDVSSIETFCTQSNSSLRGNASSTLPARSRIRLSICARLFGATTAVTFFRFSVCIGGSRSEEHTSELQSLMRISYAVFCLKKKTNTSQITTEQRTYKEHHR